MKIRDAVAGDAAAVAEMANGLAAVTQAGPGTMTAENVRSDLIDGDGLRLIVGEIEGQVTGYALYSVAYETALSARGLYLSDLFVVEQARRTGLAKALMAELAGRCRAEGGVFIWWIVLPGNPAGEAFYKSLGAMADPLNAMAIHGDAFDRLLEAH